MRVLYNVEIAEIHCLATSNPPAMTDALHVDAPLTDSLQSDILLLTSYLSGRQCSVKAPTHDENLAFSAHISTLVAIGYNQDQPLQNANAVIGNYTVMGPEFLVCVEQDEGPVDRAGKDNGSGPSCGITVKSSTCRARGPAQDNVECERSINKNAGELSQLFCIFPIPENGRKLLDTWGPRTQYQEKVDFSM